MSVLSKGGRDRVDRIAATVGGLAFLAGVVGIAVGGMTPADGDTPSAVTTTVASTPVPGDPVTMSVQSTEPPFRAGGTPRVTEEVTVTEGSGPGSVVVTTTEGPAAATTPFLGSAVSGIVFQFILVTLAALLLAIATQRILLGEYSFRRAVPSGGLPVVDEGEAMGVKDDVVAAKEAPDLSRPLFTKAGVTDTRLRLIQDRIALELEVRRLAQDNDLPSGLTMPYVVRGLVEKKKMTERLASAVTALSSIGDRLGSGAVLSPDTTTLLTEAYAQALAKVGGKIRK